MPQTVERASKHKSEFSFSKFLHEEKSGVPSPEVLNHQREEQQSYGSIKEEEKKSERKKSEPLDNVIIQNVEDLEIVIDESDNDPHEFSAHNRAGRITEREEEF